MQVEKACYAVVILLTYWVLESGEGFGFFLFVCFFIFFSLMELLSAEEPWQQHEQKLSLPNLRNPNDVSLVCCC